MSINATPVSNPSPYSGIEEELEKILPPDQVATIGSFLGMTPQSSITLAVARVSCKTTVATQDRDKAKAATRNLFNSIIGYMGESPPINQYAKDLVESLQQTLNNQKEERKKSSPHNSDENLLYDAILKRVSAKLDKHLLGKELLQEVFYSLWDSVIKRLKGKVFLQKHLGNDYVADVEKGLTDRLIPPWLYMEAERWVWDDNLITLASKIPNAPRALPNQSPKEHANAIRTWLNNPANVESITDLDLSASGLTFLPPEIGNLTALRNLNISHNKLSTLPPEIGKLTALQWLNISNNQLHTLPPEIGNLTALQDLWVADNKLTTLPPEIGNLTALQFLNISNNQLRTLPREIGYLTALQKLDLSYNQLITLPQEIGYLTALQWLNISHNKLNTLPREIGNLTTLQELYLSDNQLSTLPPEIGNLTVLQELYLSDNQLSTLPRKIGNLTALQKLDLSQNKLNTLPREIGYLTALQELYLLYNKLSTLPPEIDTLRARGCYIETRLTTIS